MAHMIQLYLLLLTVVFTGHVCTGLILLIRNPNVIQHKLIGQPIDTEVIKHNIDDVFHDEIESICFTINGRICECFYPNVEGVINTVLTASCVLTDDINNRDGGSYWFGAIATQIIDAYKTEIASIPIHVARSLSALVIQESRDTMVTLVLPLTLGDFARSLILFQSLVKFGYGQIYEMLIFCPDAQQLELQELMERHGMIAQRSSEPGTGGIGTERTEGSSSQLHQLHQHQHQHHDNDIKQIRLKFPVRLIEESVLFNRDDLSTYHQMLTGEKYTGSSSSSSAAAGGGPNRGHSASGGAFPYGIQMAVKLLAAFIVHTKFYLTLDADCVLLQQWRHPSQIFVEFQVKVGREHTADTVTDSVNARDSDSDGIDVPLVTRRLTLAIHDFESRVYGDHPDWWDSSDQFLQLPHWELQTAEEREKQGFSVTPALMSTYGSLLTVERVLTQVRHHHCGIQFVPLQGNNSGSTDPTQCNAMLQWLVSFGRTTRWTEYTLYAIVLDYYQLFNSLHASQQALQAKGPEWAAQVASLHCFDLWYYPTIEFYSQHRDNIWLQIMYEHVRFIAAGDVTDTAVGDITDTAVVGGRGIGAVGIDNSPDHQHAQQAELGTCLFSVIQSHAQLSVETVQAWTQRLSVVLPQDIETD